MQHLRYHWMWTIIYRSEIVADNFIPILRRHILKKSYFGNAGVIHKCKWCSQFFCGIIDKFMRSGKISHISLVNETFNAFFWCIFFHILKEAVVMHTWYGNIYISLYTFICYGCTNASGGTGYNHKAISWYICHIFLLKINIFKFIHNAYI